MAKTFSLRGKGTDVIVRRKGGKVRYQNNVTRAFTGWENNPDIPKTVEPLAPAVGDVARVNYLNRMTVAELRSLAGDRGKKIPSKWRKADIIIALTEV